MTPLVRLFAILPLAVVGSLLAACDDGTGAEQTVTPSTSTSSESAPASGTPQTLTDGVVTGGRYVVMPPAKVGWSECNEFTLDCPKESPQAKSLKVELTIPAGWEAGYDSTVVVPEGLARGSSEAPDGAGLVIGWTNPTAGLHSDPCLPVFHKTPDIQVGPSVRAFVDAVLAQPTLDVESPVDAELGGYSGQHFTMTTPSDISECVAWRPFEPGIFAQGPENQWSVWVMDIESFRMIVLAEEFADTPANIKAELSAMVESIEFQP